MVSRSEDWAEDEGGSDGHRQAEAGDQRDERLPDRRRRLVLHLLDGVVDLPVCQAERASGVVRVAGGRGAEGSLDGLEVPALGEREDSRVTVGGPGLPSGEEVGPLLGVGLGECGDRVDERLGAGVVPVGGDRQLGAGGLVRRRSGPPDQQVALCLDGTQLCH